MKNLLIIIFLSLGLAVTAQKFSIKGTVSDTLNKAMPSATVMLLNPKDSSLVNFGVTNASGNFEIKNVNKGTYQLKITFVGFASYVKNFSTPETGNVMDLGPIKMLPKSFDLDEVVIQGEKNPVMVKRDTIEFNAGSFKTKANANVEDLLKKMPGMEVESDGTVRAQGEEVQQVTVDGREFFGRDPKLATRNLPADAVDKVQVFDKKSEQSTFTGIDDGSKTKTINLELKEEKRNAAFGTMMGGVGTNDRFQAKANINRFNKGKQFSFLGMGNNVNEQGFSIDDYMNFSGGGQQMMGGGGGRMTIQIDGNNSSGVPLNFGGRQNGIMTNYAGGLNFNQDFNNKKTQVGGNYFYSRLEQNVIKDVNRINYLPNDSSYLFNQNSAQLSNSDSHRANLIVDHSIDSANSLKLNSNFSYTDSEQNATILSETLLEDGTKINDSNRKTYNASTNIGLNNNLLWRHRFAKKGRTISTNFLYNISQIESNGNQQTVNNFGANEKQDIIQTNTQTTDAQSAGVSVSHTEPLGNRKYLEANYNFRTNKNEVDCEVFDNNTGMAIKNNFLSNEYNSNYLYNKPGLNFRINCQKFNLTTGVSYQSTTLKGDLISRNATINRSFQNWLPVARFNYDFSNFKHLRLDYETNMQEPSITQLQPVVDNSDPLNIVVGNPDLKPAYTQTGNLHFTTFDPAKFINFFAMGTVNYQTNAIVNSQQVDSRLRRTTRPVNVKDALTMNANLNFGFPIRKLKSRFNIGSTIANGRSLTLLNDEENTIRTETLGGNVRYNFTYKEFFTLDLSANVRNQATKYDFDTNQNQQYINSTYTAETNITILKKYQINADFNYYMYDSRTNDFNQAIPILNIWLSRFIMKANAGEIKVGVSNLLDRSLSVTQTASANYLQQETINNLGRYVMASFTYALNKQLNPFGGGRRPGGMRMMMRTD
jgi:Outer membrane protein beta-barrel family/Carboxypeptidase regulatory-like domain